MKCPHCLESFYATLTDTPIVWSGSWTPDATPGYWVCRATRCPACGRNTILLRLMHKDNPNLLVKETMVWPRGVARAPIPKEVPEKFAAGYREACDVFAGSANASAALSRRYLQLLLREVAGVKASDLSKEIDAVLPSLPSAIAEAVDAVRVIGNFAAHPIKSTNTGEIVDVEPGEAEWSLDVLESLFDFYFVQPAKLAAKKAEMNKKLTDAGKPPMK